MIPFVEAAGKGEDHQKSGSVVDQQRPCGGEHYQRRVGPERWESMRRKRRHK